MLRENSGSAPQPVAPPRSAFTGIGQEVESFAQLFFRGVIHGIEYFNSAVLERKCERPKNLGGAIFSEIDGDEALQVDGAFSNLQWSIHESPDYAKGPSHASPGQRFCSRLRDPTSFA